MKEPIFISEIDGIEINKEVNRYIEINIGNSTYRLTCDSKANNALVINKSSFDDENITITPRYGNQIEVK